MPNTPNSVQYQVQMDAAQALTELHKLTSTASTLPDVFNAVQASVETFAQKTGMSLMAVETLFSRVMVLARNMKDKISSGELTGTITPDQQMLADLAGKTDPFAHVGEAATWKQVNSQLKETHAGMQVVNADTQQLKGSLASVAEQYALIDAYAKRGFQNIKFGSNIEANRASIDALKTSMIAVRDETGKSFEEIGATIQKNFTNIPKFAVTTSVKELNAELTKIPTLSQAARGALNSIAATSLPGFAGLKNFDTSTIDKAKASMTNLLDTMRQLRKDTGAQYGEVGDYIKANFPNIDSIQVTAAVKQLNQELLKTQTQAQLAAQALKGLSSSAVMKSIAALKFTPSTAAASFDSLKASMASLKQTTGATFEQIGKYIQDTFTNVPKPAVMNAVKDLNKELNGVQASSNRAVRGLDAVRIALGAITAMIVFQVIQAFTTFFSKAIEGARQLELAVYNVMNAERLMSERGIEINVEDIQDIATEVQKLVPIFSHVDVSNAVSGIALFTKDLGLTKEQVEALSKSIAVLTVRNRAFGLTFEQVRSQVLTGLLTGRAQGIRDLGVSVSETTIQAEALRLGLVKDKEAFDALSGEMEANIKAQALVSIITQSTAGEMENLGQYMDTQDAKLMRNAAAWEDFGTTIGRSFLKMVPDMSGAMEKVQKAIEVGGIQGLFTKAVEKMKGFDKYNLQNISIISKLNFGIKLTQQEYDHLKSVLDGLDPKAILDIFPDPSAIKDRFTRELVQSLVSNLDTATNATGEFGEALLDLQAILDNVKFDDFIKDLAELQEKMREAEEEFNLDRARDLEDYNLERIRDEQDHLLEEQKIIEDAAKKRHEKEEDYRNKEKEAEARFQERMRQLREKFLYNLEDALRDRDARQILRLIREYQMEKQNLTNEEAIRKEFAAKEHAEEMERIREEEADRLAELDKEFAIEQQRKAEDFALKQARAAEDHAREMEDLRTQMDEKMKEFADKLAEELGLREGGANDIYKMLKDYYGEGGKFDKLYAYSAESMLAYTQAMIDNLNTYLGQVQGLASTIPGGGLNTFPINPPHSGGGTGDRRGHASGGTFLATSPTQAIFGEAGRELVTFTPTKDMNQMGMGGKATVTIRLMEGLKAEIVDSALNDMAIVIEQTQRSMA